MESGQVKKTGKKIERTQGEIVELHPTKPDITEHKKAEEAVRRSKQQWENTFNAMSDWVILIDLGGRIIRTNRAGENFTGKPLAEIVGQSCCKLVHGSEEHIPDCPLTKMLRTGQQASTELQVSGTDQWLMVTVDPVTDREGNIVGAVHITRDITDRKQAEKAVRDSEERYKYLFEQSPLGIVLASPDGKVARANKTMEVITGYFEAELKKLNLVDLYENPEDRKKLLGTIERYGCAVDFPARLKRKDGTLFDALLNVSRVNLGGQDLFQTICMDITERKRAERALQESEERFKQVAENAQEWIWEVDANGLYTYASPTVERILSYKPEEIVGIKHFYDLFHTEDKERLKKEALEVFSKKKPFREFINRNMHKNGQTIWLSTSGVPIIDGNGNLLGYRGTDTDITERKRAEEALRQSEESFRNIYENALVGLYRTTPDGRILMSNPALLQMLGYSNFEELAERNLEETGFEPGYPRSVFKEQIEKEGQVVGLESAWTRRDGTSVYVRESAKAVCDEKGNTLYYEGTVEDITERKRAQEALRESEERISQIIQENSIATFVIDSNHIITHWNRACENLTGISASEAIGTQKQWSAFYSAKRPVMADLIADGAPEDGIERHYSGKYRKSPLIESAYEAEDFFPSLGEKGKWLFFTAAPLKNIKGRVIGAIETFQDITERKQTEEQIEKLARFPAENPNPVLRISARGTVVYGNEASLPLLKAWQCRVGGSVSGRWYEFVLDALGSGQSQQAEVQCDGQTFSLVFEPVMDANYVNVYGLDITDRKKAEEAAREGRDYLEKLTNSMWDAVFSVKMPERVIEWANDSFRLAGYEPEDCVGSTTEFLYPDRKEYIDFGNKLKKTIEAGEDVLHAEQILRRKNGETFPAEITTTIFREKGEITKVTSIVRDITKRKRSEEKLLEYQEQLKSLASQLTLTEERERRRIATDLHDNITQSLAMSKLKLDLVRDSKHSSSADLVEVLNETSRNIEHIIQEVRTLTFDLSSPILYELGFEAAVAEWLTERIEKEHYIATEFEDDGQPKPLDDDTRTVLFRDVRELLTNVVKHAQAKKVRVSIRKDHSRIHVSVEDDGRGFDPEKAAATAAKAGEFGLFSIRERLKQLGGNIEIESVPGHGTRVTLVAPLKSNS